MSTKIANLFELITLWIVVGGVVFSLVSGLAVVEGRTVESNALDNGAIVLTDNSLEANSSHFLPKGIRGSLIGTGTETYKVAVTAYSSSPYETDSSPFITASGDWVEDGIVAANFLSFGTKIRIPELFGDKVFTVQDRMHPRKKYQVDVWFPSRDQAIQFGAHYSYIELVEEI